MRVHKDDSGDVRPLFRESSRLFSVKVYDQEAQLMRGKPSLIIGIGSCKFLHYPHNFFFGFRPHYI